jgi:hypothetical protein
MLGNASPAWDGTQHVLRSNLDMCVTAAAEPQLVMNRVILLHPHVASLHSLMSQALTKPVNI